MSETMQMETAQQARDAQQTTEPPAEIGSVWEKVPSGTHWKVTDFNGFEVRLEQTDGNGDRWVCARSFPTGYVRE